MTTTDMQMTDYLARLRAALTGMTLAEREDIVQEIQMHIRERSSDPQTSVGGILAGLGPADELAQQYRTGLLVQKARHSISPLPILRATLRWATTGVEGFVVFMIAITVYADGWRLPATRVHQAILAQVHRTVGRPRRISFQCPHGRDDDQSCIAGSRGFGVVVDPSSPCPGIAQSGRNDKAYPDTLAALPLEGAIHCHDKCASGRDGAVSC